MESFKGFKELIAKSFWYLVGIVVASGMFVLGFTGIPSKSTANALSQPVPAVEEVPTVSDTVLGVNIIEYDVKGPDGEVIGHCTIEEIPSKGT